MKCSGTQPCDDCQTRGLECVYVLKKKRGPQSGEKKELETKLNSTLLELSEQKRISDEWRHRYEMEKQQTELWREKYENLLKQQQVQFYSSPLFSSSASLFFSF